MKVLGYVSDAQLRWLYKEASAFVLPSLLEGFGMPALEAALHGLVPIISRDSALAEAVNGLAIHVDPLSVSDIGEAMESVLALDERRRDELKSALGCSCPECHSRKISGGVGRLDQLGTALISPIFRMKCHGWLHHGS